MTIAKAVVAAILAGLGAAATAWASGGFNVGAWIAIAIATLGTFSGTYWVPNAPQPPMGGHRRAPKEPSVIASDEPRGGLFHTVGQWVDLPRPPWTPAP